jgi:hypothetical protein
MSSTHLLDPFAFARFGAYLGWPAEVTADALAKPEGYDLRSDVALRLAEDAVAERAHIDAWQEELLDELARQEEFHLGEPIDLPVLPSDVVVDGTLEAQTQVRQAYRAASAFHETLGLGESELMALVTGAYLVEPTYAGLIARTVLDEGRAAAA